MPTVTALRESEWNKDGSIVKVTNVTLDDGREAPGYDLPPGLEVGKPLPEGWEVATAKSGKLYIKVPRAGGKGGFGGGAAAWRNTKEGAWFEAVARAVNTAVMQSDTQEDAERWLAWSIKNLRELAGGTAAPAAGAGAPPSGVPARSKPAPAPPSAPAVTSQPSGSVSEGPGADTFGGGQSSSEKADGCLHRMTVKTNPAGHPLPAGFERCADCNTTWRVT